MPRICQSCGETKGLKAIIDASDYTPHSICKSCYFEECSCEEDNHDVSECLESPSCPNHKNTVERMQNWDNLDYHYKPKRLITLRGKG